MVQRHGLCRAAWLLLDMATPAVRMRWDDLLFLHWPVPERLMRALVPESLDLDLFEGEAWIALVPFRMEQTRFRGVPELPGLGSFFECNVRTYVKARDAQGRMHAGVWFFSLDAERLIPVVGGRALWSLNYIYSRFEVDKSGSPQTIDYTVTRRGSPGHSSHVRWRRGDALDRAAPGTLEHFLTERYWLFTVRRGAVMGGRIEHDPWPLRRATVEGLDDTLVRAAGFDVRDEPLAWHSDSIDVSGWKLVRMDRYRHPEPAL